MSSTPEKIPKVTSIDMKNSNLWIGCIMQCASSRGTDLEIKVPIGLKNCREIMITVSHNPEQNFNVEPQSEVVILPANSLKLQHKIMPVNPKGNNTLVYLKTEDENSFTVAFNKYNQTFFTCGKIAWR